MPLTPPRLPLWSTADAATGAFLGFVAGAVVGGGLVWLGTL